MGRTAVTVKDSANKSATFSLTVYAATNTALRPGVGTQLERHRHRLASEQHDLGYLDQGATQTYFCGIPTDTTGDTGARGLALADVAPAGSYLLSVTDGCVTVDSVFSLNPAART